MPLTLSDAAVRRLRFLRQKESAPFFRVRVDTGGCAGFQYIFLFDDKATPDDVRIDQGDVSVLIDDLSLSFLQGAELDYQEEMMGSAFVINNPNAARSCGCKTSFQPK
jgi:iron-sulfur cluster insertion protein